MKTGCEELMDELVADLNAQDDEGLGWSTLVSRAGSGRGRCSWAGTVTTARSTSPSYLGPVAKHRHLLDRTVA